VPPRVEYALTEKGLALLPIIEDMRSYGERWLGLDCQDGVKTALAVAVA
jgi:DNA-binding HxlR family transcriptional regulator